MPKMIRAILKMLVLACAIYLKFGIDLHLSVGRFRIAFDAISSLFITLLVLNLALSFIIWGYRKKGKLPEDYRDNFTQGVSNLFSIFYVLAFTVFFFLFVGIDLRTLFTSISIVAAAIAIVTKELIFDLIVGILMSFSKDFDRKDYVKINEQKGRILEVGLLKLKLLNDDDDIVFLPNKKVYDSEVINYTKRDIRAMSIDFQIGLINFGTIDDLEIKLKDSISDYHKYIDVKSFTLKVVHVMKDYLDLKFQYTIKELDRDLQKNIRRQTYRKIISYVAQNREIENIH